MAEIRHRDGTVVWRGESPGAALAAIEQLDKKASEYSLHGLDSTDLEDAKPTKAKLISEKPKPTYRIANADTGEVEQSGYAKRGDAEAELKRLRRLDAPGDVAREFSEVIPKEDGRPIRFAVEPE